MVKFMELSEITEFIRNGLSVKQDSAKGGLPITRIETISDGSINIEKVGFADLLDESLYEDWFLKNGDILMSHINSDKHLGKCALVDIDYKLIHGMNLLNIRVKKDLVESAYLKYYFFTNYFRKDINKIMKKSVNQASFSINDFKKFQIPLPPLDIQKKIADTLDKAQELIDKRKEQITALDKFLENLFLDMFGDPVSNPMGWEISYIEQLVLNEKGSIKRGPFGGALKKEIFVNEGYLVYEQYHALNNDFSFERYYITEKKFNELKGFEVKEGDIIISCSGVYLGKLAVSPKNHKKGSINQALLKISLNESKMKNIFYKFVFTHPNFKNKYFANTNGSGIPNFPSMEEFKKFKFILPPLDLQNQFASLVEKVEAEKTKLEASLKEMEDNFNSIMQRAFKGELF